MLLQIRSAEHIDIEDTEIKNRLSVSPKSKNTKLYLAKENDSEIGFVSIDEFSGVQYIVLYEVFVSSHLRNQGYGSKLLFEVESLAKKLGYKKIIVNPEPFEMNYPKRKLIKWYEKNGYQLKSSITGELQKEIDHYKGGKDF